MPVVSDRTRDVVAWVLILALIVGGVLSTWRTNDRLAEQQAAMQRQQQCTTAFLATTVEALNERTDLSAALNEADAERIKAQGAFIGFLVQGTRPGAPEPSAADYREALGAYFDKVQAYLDLLTRQKVRTTNFPYPSSESYVACLEAEGAETP